MGARELCICVGVGEIRGRGVNNRIRRKMKAGSVCVRVVFKNRQIDRMDHKDRIMVDRHRTVQRGEMDHIVSWLPIDWNDDWWVENDEQDRRN